MRIRISSMVLCTGLTASVTSVTLAFTLPNSHNINNYYISHHESQTTLKMADTDTRVSTSTDSKTGRSRQEIQSELSSGRALDGGPVIDFGSVKDSSSKAELALVAARQLYLQQIQTHGKDSVKLGFANSNANTRLMGINDEVVAEVGREIGAFVSDPNIVRECAAYLRSKAPPGLFQNHPDADADLALLLSSSSTSNSNPTIPPSKAQEFDSLLLQSYTESGLVTEAFAKTFYLGTQLLPPEAREAIWAVYVWCRRTDEIVDAPRTPEDVDMLTDLSAWEVRLENLFYYGLVEDVLDLPLLDCKIKYPNLPIEPFLDMIRGMLMDIPDLGQDRYDTFDELHLYCYRVAGTVGLMSMPIFGCAPGFTDDDAKEPALSLGVAFQITNILRDVGEDAVKRGRIYLPRQDMAKFNVTEEQIFNQQLDDNYISLMKYEIARARMYYARAKRGVPMLSPYSRLPVQSSLDCYGKILDKIEENGYDSLTKRAYVSKWEKMAEIPFSWYRTLDIAKILPLPGDEPLK